MIPQYGELNRIYTDILSGKGFSFEKQKFISDFYRQHEDTQAFETSLIGMVFETDAEHRSLLLNSLKREIESNISIYNANQPRLDNIDTWLISRDHADRFDWSIDNQMKTTREYNKELIEANGSLEAMVYRAHDRQEDTIGANGNMKRKRRNWTNCTTKRNKPQRKHCHVQRTVSRICMNLAATCWLYLKST